MGQYFKPAILAKNKKTVLKWFYSHTYGNADNGFCGLKLMEHSWMKNRFVGAVEKFLLGNPQRIVWAGDYAENCKDRKTNVYDRCKDKTEVNPSEIPPQVVKAKYIVNHTKKEFIDKSKVPNVNGWRIHPLPLMTCDSNNSGGSFCGKDPNKLVGSWKKDIISVESRKPKGFKEVVFDLVEI